jgi:hypothetical protein
MQKLIVVLIVLVVSLTLQSKPNVLNEKVIDEGTTALSKNSTAIWLINELESGENYIPFVIVFRGSENWHEQKVVVSDDLSSDPVQLNWKVGDNIKIKIEYAVSSNSLNIYGDSIELNNGNVIFVDNIDTNPKVVNIEKLQIVGQSQIEDISNYLISNSESVSEFIK